MVKQVQGKREKQRKKLALEGAERMYKDNSQLRIYGELDPENDRVRLAALVLWDIAEERYAARFVNNGHPARTALDALLIQRRLKCSDEWVVKHIGENPYLQYFIGMKRRKKMIRMTDRIRPTAGRWSWTPLVAPRTSTCSTRRGRRQRKRWTSCVN